MSSSESPTMALCSPEKENAQLVLKLVDNAKPSDEDMFDMIDFSQAVESENPEPDPDHSKHPSNTPDSPPPQIDTNTIVTEQIKCQGRNAWCNGFCMQPYRTIRFLDGNEFEVENVSKDELCRLTVQMWRDFDRIRREKAREESQRRRERLQRIKNKRATFRKKVPWWKKSEVQISSPLGWDDGS